MCLTRRYTCRCVKFCVCISLCLQFLGRNLIGFSHLLLLPCLALVYQQYIVSICLVVIHSIFLPPRLSHSVLLFLFLSSHHRCTYHFMNRPRVYHTFLPF